MYLDLWLRQMVVDQRIYVHSVCKLKFCVHGSHNRVSNAVATFSQGHLLLFEDSKCVFKCERRTCSNVLALRPGGIASFECNGVGPGGCFFNNRLMGVWFSLIGGFACCVHMSVVAQIYSSTFDVR